MPSHAGRWHGRRRYFGLHYDLHARPDETELGVDATPGILTPQFERLGIDFAQTDCKGHAGYTSWFSRAPEASVSPGVRRDALAGWRAATAALGLPLHCHYSGIWDAAAGEKHPEWCRVDGAGEPVAGRMCPRSPYLDELVLPQFRELIDRYGVDGFWVDGDIWATEPCYCPRCREAFTAATGIAAPPMEPGEANWESWFKFTLRSFEEYVARYCQAVHEHKDGVLVCSNWLQTFHHPGEPWVPTDWISGDNTWVFGLDKGRCEARFISTRGKPWDIMIWSFYASQGMGDPRAPWTVKPVAMIQQEAAVVTALGGNVQVYENPGGLRTGQLVPWRVERLRQVGRFVKARRSICQGAETVPQIAVLHSECHGHRHASRNCHKAIDVAPVQGAVCSLLECHYGVDILDEWALGQRLSEFPVVVAPEQDDMSAQMVRQLREYVTAGGRLLVSGAAAADRFTSKFLGVSPGKVVTDAGYHVPADDGSFHAHSKSWRLLKASKASALGQLATSPLLDQRLLPHPAATLHKVGKGAVAYVPFDIFRYLDHNRYPLAKAFIRQVAQALVGRLPIRVKAPACVDVVLRRKGDRQIVHLINRASGIPQRPNDGTVDEIPPVGPIQLEIDMPTEPAKVSVALEKGKLESKCVRQGKEGWRVSATLDLVKIHAAVVVES
jgi:hypothetical protein